jgi:phospholipid/cholesterol/gamma-HCH transport system substrate-binding protein
MPSIRTQFSVGLFVVVGMAVVVVFILWLGLVQYFAEGRKYVAYFDESVQGLQQDSAVKYRGVDIGRVDDIRVAPDGRLVQIVLDLREPLHHKDSMYAQIKSVGITGIMFVELERLPPGETIQQQKLDFEPEHPVIATKPSEIKQLLTDLYGIIEEIRRVDFRKISEDVSETLESVNQTLEGAEVRKISGSIQKVLLKADALLAPQEWRPIRENMTASTEELEALISQASDAVTSASRMISEQNQRFTKSIEALHTTVEHTDQMIGTGNRLIVNTDQRMARIQQQLTSTLESLETVGVNLNRLIEDLADQPSRLIFSEPPPPRNAGGGKGE